MGLFSVFPDYGYTCQVSILKRLKMAPWLQFWLFPWLCTKSRIVQFLPLLCRFVTVIAVIYGFWIKTSRFQTKIRVFFKLKNRLKMAENCVIQQKVVLHYFFIDTEKSVFIDWVNSIPGPGSNLWISSNKRPIAHFYTKNRKFKYFFLVLKIKSVFSGFFRGSFVCLCVFLGPHIFLRKFCILNAHLMQIRNFFYS